EARHLNEDHRESEIGRGQIDQKPERHPAERNESGGPALGDAAGDQIDHVRAGRQHHAERESSNTEQGSKRDHPPISSRDRAPPEQPIPGQRLAMGTRRWARRPASAAGGAFYRRASWSAKCASFDKTGLGSARAGLDSANRRRPNRRG